MFYLDSDGVFARWRKYVLSTHFPGMTIKQFNAIPELRRRSLTREMYQRDPDLFYKLEPIEGVQRILETVDRLCDSWAILTSGSEDHYDHQLVVDSKQRWFLKHFGVPADKVIVTENSGQKASYASRGNLLVDDYGRNCREWILQGGGAIWSRTEEPKIEAICLQCEAFYNDPISHSGTLLQI
ncbi:hypothetical protein pEaSNUABM29_00184 [Erwinia phage pEa_SNUABM_29]|nr:hypothetical protein pEaSNUABM29_00184 [Erwinia phage pEa_SNUABM_29]